MTRHMYALLNSRMYWCQRLEINPEARSELEFWDMQVDCINGHEIWHSPSAVRVVYSDASDSGYRGFTGTWCLVSRRDVAELHLEVAESSSDGAGVSHTQVEE